MVARSTYDDIDTINASIDSQTCILKVTPYVRQDLSLESELSDGFAVFAGLLRAGWASELNILDAEIVKSPPIGAISQLIPMNLVRITGKDTPRTRF